MKIKNLKMYKGMLIVVDMVNGFAKKCDLADPKIGRCCSKTNRTY